ncbi:cobyric acid synthase CobQ [Geoglobus acetivorans]|uniref:Probable cobyric acid synthase n=1 Tax=Geoglobus acetivorans TaxID=565033 RepID=A0ABZ3H289_GEOAI|nr:cobyric acid synthase CobQ [Geoglobus acetivorans]
MPSIMVGGTTSSAGKSVIVAALCRIFSKMGYEVAPFKAQNMSLNSYITGDGHEIAYAQAFQAFACGKEPDVRMNPVLLKPKGNLKSQLVVMGKARKDVSALEYYREIPDLMKTVEQAYRELESENDFVIIEGAGGMAEINLYDRDMANIGIARIARPDIYIVSDIDRGGTFASLYGTYSLLPDDVRTLVRGFIINKFRGYENLLYSGIDELEKLTGVGVVGIVPYFYGNLPSEDSLSIDEWQEGGEIGIIRLPRVSNFTDFEPVRDLVSFVSLRDEIDDYSVIVIPGTKETLHDLRELKRWGMDRKILKFARDRPVIGICGGFQILGREIIDRLENLRARGLGLIDSVTEFVAYDKITRQVEKRITGRVAIIDGIVGETVRGYEIHMGRTMTGRPVFEDDGGMNESGLVWGTYLHGLFFNENVRKEFYRFLNRKYVPYEDPIDKFVETVHKKIDLDHILSGVMR